MRVVKKPATPPPPQPETNPPRPKAKPNTVSPAPADLFEAATAKPQSSRGAAESGSGRVK